MATLSMRLQGLLLGVGVGGFAYVAARRDVWSRYEETRGAVTAMHLRINPGAFISDGPRTSQHKWLTRGTSDAEDKSFKAAWNNNVRRLFTFVHGIEVPPLSSITAMVAPSPSQPTAPAQPVEAATSSSTSSQK